MQSKTFVEFKFKDIKTVHHQVFAEFSDQDVESFVDSDLFQKIASTVFVEEKPNGLDSRLTCNVENIDGFHFKQLEGDFDYLKRWYHNPYRKANTRHGSFIMLYLTEQGYVWKLNSNFFSKLLWISDDINELFDFG